MRSRSQKTASLRSTRSPSMVGLVSFAHCSLFITQGARGEGFWDRHGEQVLR